MNVSIENYRGFEIIFNTESERFSFTLDEGGWNEKQSYSACKRNIDEFLKNNQEFNPFWIANKYSRGVRYKVIGIRKDGRFAVENIRGEKEQLSQYDEKNYILYIESDEQYYAQIAILEAEVQQAKDKISEIYKSIKTPSIPEIRNDFSLLRKHNREQALASEAK